MHVMTVTGHDPGDYLHPDQKLDIVDEVTGNRFGLYLRSNACASTAGGEVSLFVPTAAIREIQIDRDYCVVTLSTASTADESEERRERLAGTAIGPARRTNRGVPTGKGRTRRATARS